MLFTTFQSVVFGNTFMSLNQQQSYMHTNGIHCQKASESDIGIDVYVQLYILPRPRTITEHTELFAKTNQYIIIKSLCCRQHYTMYTVQRVKQQQKYIEINLAKARTSATETFLCNKKSQRWLYIYNSKRGLRS